MTLMTNDLNDHFFGGRGKGGREKRKTVGVSPFCLRAPRDLRWNRRERGTGGRRERKKN